MDAKSVPSSPGLLELRTLTQRFRLHFGELARGSPPFADYFITLAFPLE